MKYLAGHPSVVVFGSFGAFLSTFAYVDYNREVTTAELTGFKRRESNHLGEALEQFHFQAFSEKMTLDDIRADRFRCEELYFLFKTAVKKKDEWVSDPELKGKSETDIENLVAKKLYDMGQRMCRRAMIRNRHFVKWFKATMQDEFIKFYVLPIVGFFGARYFKLFDRKTGVPVQK
jgi:hypothetical protein